MILKIRLAPIEPAPYVPILLIIYEHVTPIYFREILMVLEFFMKFSHSSEFELHIIIQIPPYISQ